MTQPNLVQIVAGVDVSFYSGRSTLMRMAFDGSPSNVVDACNYVFAFGWSRDGTKAAYLTDLADYAVGQMHLIADGRDRSIDIVPGLPISGCVAPCDEWVDIRVLFSPDGRYVSLVSYWATPTLRIWSVGGQLLKKIEGDDPGGDHAGPTMGVWSGDGFFWRDSKGVEIWRNGVQSLALPGVRWLWPRASPTNQQIVYTVKDSAGVPSVFALDSRTGQSRMLMRLRSHVAFLNSRFLWYEGERSCTPADQYPCGQLESAIPTGKTFVYDLNDGTESESIITSVWDVWPHPA